MNTAIMIGDKYRIIREFMPHRLNAASLGCVIGPCSEREKEILTSWEFHFERKGIPFIVVESAEGMEIWKEKA